MAHKITTVILGNSHLRPSNGWTSQAYIKDILSSFILSIALYSTEAEFFNKFSPKVEDNHFGCSDLKSFSFDSVKVFLLPNIGKETDDFISGIKQPTEDAASVKAAYDE
ncbi:MAG: hypothetical protein LQ343_002205 [Gyalolechia ehrenbergii]|nr:MAG: hypothetical protein LQ343_002205 [Gyalolechia ehrenbergii]